MKQDDFNNIVKKQTDDCLNLLITKGAEYDNNNYDRLHSFKVAANLQGCTQIQALAGMMAKHTVSIYEMCKNKDNYTLTKWEEKIVDNINYLLLLRAMLEDDEK